ncbi:MAG: hypothetical protein ACK5TY_03550 [Verrucomicrobiota bacterium]|jgi:hypothetical protein
MNSLTRLLPLILLMVPALPCPAEDKRIEAFSRIHYHRDGTRTESLKDGTGTRIKEKTYNENSVLVFVREFETDRKGRLRNGVIYDGKKNVLGSMYYGYDSATDQIVEERLFNAKGNIIRRLFYPGALKDPRFAKRFVAFNYDPDNPAAKPVADTKDVKPVRPVEQAQDSFDPGTPMGKGPAPSLHGAAKPAPAAAAKPPGRSFLPQRKPGGSAAAPAPAPVPVPKPAAPAAKPAGPPPKPAEPLPLPPAPAKPRT